MRFPWVHNSEFEERLIRSRQRRGAVNSEANQIWCVFEKVRTHFRAEPDLHAQARGGLKLHCTLRLRGDANQCASDTPCGFLGVKTKFFTFLLSSAGVGEPTKMERKFNGFASLFQSPKRALLFYHFCCSFSPSRRPRRTRIHVWW